MKREIAKSRPESRPRPRQRREFFWASCSNLEIDENFRISHNLGLGLAAKISQAFAIQLGRYRDQNTHPAPTAHPPKNPYLVCWCTLSRTCVDHMVNSSTFPPSSPYPVLPGGRNSGQKAQKGPQKKKLWPNFG